MGPEVPSKDNTPAPVAPPALLRGLKLGTSDRHLAWQCDQIIHSTGGESMQISTVRQLSRALGTILAIKSNNSTESQKLLDDIVATNPRAGDYTALLYLTVSAITESVDFEDATNRVIRGWAELGASNKTNDMLLAVVLVSVIRDSATEMLRALLKRPEPGAQDQHLNQNLNQSQDGSISVHFSHAGVADRINISVLSGRFALALMLALYEGQQCGQKHTSSKQGAPNSEATPITVELNQKRPGFPRAQTSFFHLSESDFIRAYIKATLDYAAGAYADRVRDTFLTPLARRRPSNLKEFTAGKPDFN